MNRLLRLLSGCLVVFSLGGSMANAQSVSSGDITVHYSAVPTTMLSADVARQYGITRSAQRVLVNIAVRKGQPGADAAVPSQVTVTVTNLNGQRQSLQMREVKEGEAVYYLGETRVSGHETLDFEAEVRIAGRAEPIRAVFRQEFFPK